MARFGGARFQPFDALGEFDHERRKAADQFGRFDGVAVGG